MLKRCGMVLALGLGLMAGAGAQGVNPPVAPNVPNLPPPGNNNSTTWGGPYELFLGASFETPKSTSANSEPVTTSNVAGGQFDLRYHVTDWNAVEFRIAAAYPTQVYASTESVRARAVDYSVDYAFTVPMDGMVRPFLLFGGGLTKYAPSGANNFVGASPQTKFELNYGGGFDVKLSKHWSLRLEYRGLFYRVPDFELISIGKWNHMPEPDAGFVFHF